MNIGRTVVGSFEEAGVHYDIVCQKMVDAVTVWQFQLFEGIDTWKVPSATGTPIALIDEVKKYPTPEEEVQKRVIDPINAYLKNKFEGGVAPIPTTWIEKIDALLNRIVFFRDAADLPQVKISA